MAVYLLLHFNGSDADKGPFTDSSSYGHTVAGDGTYAQLDTDYKQFGTASLLIGHYLGYVDITSTQALADSDWCIETWIRSSAIDSGHSIFNTEDTKVTINSARKLEFIYNDLDLEDYVTVTGTTALSADTFTHVAVSREGSVFRGFVGGALEFTDTLGDPADHNDAATAWTILGFLGSADTYRLDEYRVTIGEAVYTEAFTPPTEAFSGGDEPIEISVPFVVEVVVSVSVGCPFHLNIESAVSTISCAFEAGTYSKSISVPFHVNVPTAVATITVPFHVYGDLSVVGSSAFVHWQPKVVLDGTDISARLIGEIEIETEEMAAPVASFSFLPAAGNVDPLAWVGTTVTISWQRYVAGVATNTVLRFTGVVSDPTWDADQRVLSVQATSDLQGRLDRLTKAQIDALLAGVAPTYSEYVFGPEADLSGWDYAQALISTTDAVLWQDQAAVVKATSMTAKAVADYTLDDGDILAGSLGDSPQYPSRQELINKRDIVFEYRFRRRRQRQINCVFRSVDLDTPSTFLSGNMGGWELPQRSQIESAASGGGWVVIGDITYTDVWPNGYYSTYSDSGVPMMEGLSLSAEITADWCIGARWKAARRWMQDVTETATLTVQASESQSVVGILADNESYAIEDDADDEEWESSLEYDGYKTGAVLMANGVDKRNDLDELRDEFETAQEVAISKARNDILRSHRGTTVTFSSPFLPALTLGHTVAVDTPYLECKGKVRRITDRWNLDSGDCISIVDLALSRHNGAGLVTSTPVAAVEKADDPTETAPSTRLNLSLYIGGQEDRPLWSLVENESGYFVNLPFNANDGSAVITGGWNRNPLNPNVATRTYEEGFAVTYPDIAATYADPGTPSAAAVFEVAVPEDTLTITSG